MCTVKKVTEATTQEYIEATKDMKKYIGKRCTFWNENSLISSVGILVGINERRKDKFKMKIIKTKFYRGNPYHRKNERYFYDVCVPEEIIL